MGALEQKKDKIPTTTGGQHQHLDATPWSTCKDSHYSLINFSLEYNSVMECGVGLQEGESPDP